MSLLTFSSQTLCKNIMIQKRFVFHCDVFCFIFETYPVSNSTSVIICFNNSKVKIQTVLYLQYETGSYIIYTVLLKEEENTSSLRDTCKYRNDMSYFDLPSCFTKSTERHLLTLVVSLQI